MTGNKFRKTLSIFFLLFSLVLSTTATTTVNATVPASSSRISYSGNGSTTSFPFAFGVTDDDELTVQVDGIATTAFTVTCPANNCLSGGTVVMATAPSSGSTLTILRDIDITQESDFVEGSPDLAQTFEEQLDKQTMILQQLQEQIGRAPKIDAGSPYSGMSYTLPDPVPGNVIGWNTAGSDLTNYDNSGGAAVADSPIIVVDTIAELRNTIPTDGKLCNVIGYYAAGDGGGGPERIGVTGAAAGTYVDDGGSVIVPTGGDGSAAWVIPAGTRLNVLWFGADRTGVTSSVAAFTAAFAKDNCPIIPAGTFDIAGLTLTGTHNYPKTLEGEGIGVTILTGSGDLIASDGYLWAKKLTIKNTDAGTLGKLFDFGTSSTAINMSLFSEVSFGRANYHIYANRITVGWIWQECRFKEAAICSRYLYQPWACTEYGSYVWYNVIGLELKGGTSFSSYGSVYEQNTGRAVRLVSDAAAGQISSLLFSGTHFEENDSTDQHHIDFVVSHASGVIKGITFDNCTIVNNERSTTFINATQLSGRQIDNIIFSGGRVTSGQLINDLQGSNVSIDPGRGGHLLPTINQTWKKKEINISTLTSSGTRIYVGKVIAGQTHVITATVIETSAGTGGATQKFEITTTPNGEMLVNTVYDKVSAGHVYGCEVATTGSFTPTYNYDVHFKWALTSTQKVKLVVEIL